MDPTPVYFLLVQQDQSSYAYHVRVDNLLVVVTGTIQDLEAFNQRVWEPAYAAMIARGYGAGMSMYIIRREPDSFLRDKAVTLDAAAAIDYSKSEAWQ